MLKAAIDFVREASRSKFLYSAAVSRKFAHASSLFSRIFWVFLVGEDEDCPTKESRIEITDKFPPLFTWLF